LASRWPIFRNFVARLLRVRDERLKVNIGRLTLDNPVGLAAGFDKNVEAPMAYSMMGFGFAELGSITNQEQEGNPKPRLWRLPKDKSLIVYYGLANCGSSKAKARLANLDHHPIPFGISIAPSTAIESSQMADDYVKTFLELYPLADYVTLNVSCPNVARCDVFTQISFVEELLKKITDTMKGRGINKDIFVKIGPDMEWDDLDRVIDACVIYGVAAVIVTNLVKDRSAIVSKSTREELNHPGGVSGKLIFDKSNEVIKHVYKRAGDKLKIIGVGGVFTAEDAYEKIKCGATAVQLITGWIYGGPLTIRSINKGLLGLLEGQGANNIVDIVGRNN